MFKVQDKLKLIMCLIMEIMKLHIKLRFPILANAIKEYIFLYHAMCGSYIYESQPTCKAVLVKLYCSPAVQKACAHSACASKNLYLLGNSLSIAPKYQDVFQVKTKSIVKLIVLANRFARGAYCCQMWCSCCKKE